MATLAPAERGPGTFTRLKNILAFPRREWRRIDEEPGSAGRVFRRWVLPLAAIGPVCWLIGSLTFGAQVSGVTYRPSAVSMVVGALFSYAMAVLAVFALALVIDGMAPNFEGTKSRAQAMKVAAYSATASFVAGIFQLFPPMAMLGVLGLYSFYLLYLGAPLVMKVPKEKASAFTAAAMLAAALLFVLGGVVAGALSNALAPRTPVQPDNIVLADNGTVDATKQPSATRQAEEAAARAEVQAKAQADGRPVPLIAPTELAELLPKREGDWERGPATVQGGTTAAVGSRAMADYAQGTYRAQLSITDMAGMGNVAALGSALKVDEKRVRDQSYEKVSTIGGRLTNEKWDAKAKRGTYSQVVAGRFLMEAEGTAPDMVTLISLVSAIDSDKLDGMAKH